MFCILVIGNPGKGGFVSLQSILNLQPTRICVLSDNQGRKWIESNFFALELFCFHNRLLEFTPEFGNGAFAQFGTNEFGMITCLKYRIILDFFHTHKEEELVIFSDLDVFWAKPLPKTYLNSNFSLMCQADWDSNGKNRFCTGIMLVKRSGMILVNEILQFQLGHFSIGQFINDEKALNRFVFSNAKNEDIGLFDKNRIVIGHRWRNAISRSGEIEAFHANYMFGKEKELALNMFYGLKNQMPWKYLAFLLWIRIALRRVTHYVVTK